MTAHTAGSTPRPWDFDPGSQIRKATVRKGNEHFTAGDTNRYHDGLLIVYAVNHIEQAEAALREARGLIARMLTSHGNRSLTAEAHTAARAFLAEG